jgi:hypothetical protein
MNVQTRPLSEITRHAIELLSKEMGVVHTSGQVPIFL